MESPAAPILQLSSGLLVLHQDDKVEYHFDQTGNRTTREIDDVVEMEYEYDRGNQLTVEGAFEPLYNANGANTGIDGWTGSYGYNAAEQLALYETGNIVTELIYTWHYDALGRQIARTKTGTGGVANVRMYYDGLHDVQVVEESSGTETLVKTRVYGERIDELLQYTDEAAEGDPAYYAHADHLGSVMLMADADGDIAESYRYKEYGETTVVDGSFVKQTDLGSDIGNFFRYTGRERAMPGSFGNDMYWYRARSYRPEVGRFMQRDPRTYSDGSSPYPYVRGTPIIFVDSLGLQSLDPATCRASIKADVVSGSAQGAAQGCKFTLKYAAPTTDSNDTDGELTKAGSLTSDTKFFEPSDPAMKNYITNGTCVGGTLPYPDAGPDLVPGPGCKFQVDLCMDVDISSCPKTVPHAWPSSSGHTFSQSVQTATPVLVSGSVAPSGWPQTPALAWGTTVTPVNKGKKFKPLTAAFCYRIAGELACGAEDWTQTFTFTGAGNSSITGVVTTSCGKCKGGL